MPARAIIAAICSLRPASFTSRTARAVQRKIDAILARFAGDYLALPEGSRWAVAVACEFARGAVGRSRTSAEAVAVLSAKVAT